MEPLMAAAADPTDMLRAGRSGGYRLTAAMQRESIKIGRSQRVSFAASHHVAAQSAAVGLTRGAGHPGSRHHGGRRRRRAMCSRHDPLWTTADVAAFLMHGPTAARQLLQIAARRGAALAPI